MTNRTDPIGDELARRLVANKERLSRVYDTLRDTQVLTAEQAAEQRAAMAETDQLARELKAHMKAMRQKHPAAEAETPILENRAAR